MFTVTLITNPANGPLNPSWPENLRNAWGGGAVDWLAPDEAAEFEVPKVPASFDEVWGEVQSAGIDMCIQRSEGRKKKLLLADMDSTMIGQECIDEMAEVAGVGDQVREVTARAMNGELDFDGAVVARLALMEGLSETEVPGVIRDRITLTPGGATMVATMKANGAYAALVSGGFTAFTAKVGKALGFDEHRANELEIQNGTLTGRVVGPILGRESKVAALEELCAKLGIQESDVLAVGDGANDLGMLGRAGSGVAMHAKPSVAAQTDLKINHGDMTALLYLQGYAKSEFVDVPPPQLG